MKEYIYDGSFEGLLTAVFHAYPHSGECTVTRNREHVPNLVDDPIVVETSEELFQRVQKSIRGRLGHGVLKNVYYLYLSEIRGAEDLILRYLKLCYKQGPSINLAKNHDVIILVDKYTRRVGLEAHRFEGFLRFKEITPMNFYAAIEPDHNILTLIANHFTRRFSDQNFIIHDVKRKNAILYNRRDTVIYELSREQGWMIESRGDDRAFQELWKNFYQSVSIEERHNERLRRRLMPQRYWSHLTELMD